MPVKVGYSLSSPILSLDLFAKSLLTCYPGVDLKGIRKLNTNGTMRVVQNCEFDPSVNATNNAS